MSQKQSKKTSPQAALCDMVSCFRQFLQQQGNPLGHFGRKRFKVEMHIQLARRKLRFQAAFCIKMTNVLIWMRFCFMITVVIIYGFVKIIYSACLSSQKQHEKSVEMSLA